MYKNPVPMAVLTEYFARLPGIGMKTAGRLAYSVMMMEKEDVNGFANALRNVKENIRLCDICQNITTDDICGICADSSRNKDLICVVETPKDITAFERSDYNGVYHVLHGLISPLDGVTPDMLKIKQLLKRCVASGVKLGASPAVPAFARTPNSEEVKTDGGLKTEIIMATNPTVEGEATAVYIAGLLEGFNVKVTRLAFGLPIGGSLEYADELTLLKALQNRTLI
jgi:recombination protein RecR